MTRIPPHRLIGVRCRSCGSLFYPPRSFCRNCLSRSVEEVELSGRGTVLSFTTIRVPPEPWKGREPYQIAVIELPEPLRLTARLEGEGPEIGAEAAFVGQDEGGPVFQLLPKGA